jgi:hypothetical protein
MTATAHRIEAGDAIEITGRRVGDAPRRGTILAVLGETGHEHFQIRWEDGHESVAYQLGSDAIIRGAEPHH